MALLAVVFAACSGSAARHGGARTPPPTVKVGSGVVDPSATTAPPGSTAATKTTSATGPAVTTAPGAGRLEIAVSSKDSGVPARGIDVSISGPLSRVVTSDANGLVALNVPAGRYGLRIDPGCGTEIQVETGATGSAAVPEGQTVRGALSVAWRHRYAPGGKVHFRLAQDGVSAEAASGREWKVGDPYDVTFDVLDRCAAGGAGSPAPGAMFPKFTFQTPPAAHVLRPATAQANGDGKAVVRVICDSPMSEITLNVTDKEAASDTADLFDRAHLDDSPPDCVA